MLYVSDMGSLSETALDADELRACDDVWFNLPRDRDPQYALR